MRRILLTTALLAVAHLAHAATAPIGVSPGSSTGVARVGTNCPTFNWASARGAQSYKLLVYRVEDETDAPVLAVRVPGTANGWTPALDHCLEPGSEYGWTVGAVSKRGKTTWSSPILFRVEGFPASAGTPVAELPVPRASQEGRAGGVAPVPPVSLVAASAGAAEGPAAPEALASATPPISGSPSLTVDGQIHLGAASDLFRDGSVFLWEDGDSFGIGTNALANNEATGFTNLGVGIEALRDNTTGNDNTAFGFHALRLNSEGSSNTAVGKKALGKSTGTNQTAVGAFALFENQESGNTAIGTGALAVATSFNNTAVGDHVLDSLTSGSSNIAIGSNTSSTLETGSGNILIGADAAAADESNTTRIGTSQTRAFLAGVDGAMTAGVNAPVRVDASGQLGTVVVSSARFKTDVREMGTASEALRRLRPVTFRYLPEIDPSGARHYGLIAEEVLEVLPDLVQISPAGEAHGVRYDLLNVLLLNEMQKRQERLVELERERDLLRQEGERALSQANLQLRRLADRVAALEVARHPAPIEGSR